MLFTLFLAYGTMMGAAAAAASCAADNCLRAVKGSAKPTRMGTLDCSSYFLATVTPATFTSTATTTILITTTTDVLAPLARRDGFEKLVVRQVTVSPSSIPSYASACSGSARYSSACSCLGVTHSTVTAAGPLTTTTVTVASTILTTSVFARPSLVVQQFSDGYCGTPDSTPTRVLVEGQCFAALPPSYNFQLGSFSPGDCGDSGTTCLVYIYDDASCSTDYASVEYGDEYDGCVAAQDGNGSGPFRSLLLVCPDCPPA